MLTLNETCLRRKQITLILEKNVTRDKKYIPGNEFEVSKVSNGFKTLNLTIYAK